MRISRWLLERYLKHRKKSRPRKILLDLDSTDDPTHGQQEFTFFHGYFGSCIYQPLLVFDGETGDLVAALLRPGNPGAARHSVAVLRRIVKRIRQVLGSRVQIEIRALNVTMPPAAHLCLRESAVPPDWWRQWICLSRP